MLATLREGKNIFFRNVNVKIHGLKRYEGSDEDICKSIIEECYDKKKKYYTASCGNYKVFYSRDFGWCVQSLLNLGHKTRVENTLKYAMKVYSQYDQITVAINNKDKPFNFPENYSPDSVAYLFRSLRIAKTKNLIIKYKKFLNKQIGMFEKTVINEQGLLQKKHFSGMRDHIKAYGLCYDIIMACMLCDEVDKINNLLGKTVLRNVLKKYNLKKNLIKHYWNGKYFNDGIYTRYCSGHANTYLYFLDVIKDIKMLKASIKSIQQNKLDRPFPLQYGYSKDTKFIWQDVFAHDWEKDTIWAMLGLAYIDIVARVDKSKAKEHLDQYYRMILKHQCFIELYKEYEPYHSLFFTADDSMLWASMYLDLKNKLKDTKITKK